MNIVEKPSRAPTKGIARDPEFDAELGAKMRGLRVAAGLSQKALGDALGLSYQQIQKYEIGADRVAVGTLNVIVSHCGVTLAEFFSGVTSNVPRQRTKLLAAQRIGARILAVKNPQLLRRVISLLDELANFESREHEIDQDAREKPF